MTKTATISIAFLAVHATALSYVQPLHGRSLCMARRLRHSSTATDADSNNLSPRETAISDHPLAAAASSATSRSGRASEPLNIVVDRLVKSLRDQFMRVKWDITYEIRRWKDDRTMRRREYWRRVAAKSHGDSVEIGAKFDLLSSIKKWNEELSMKQSEYWRRIAATDHGDSIDGGRKFDFLYTKDNLLKALGLALTAAAISIAISTSNQATAVATTVPTKQMLASSVTNTISDFVKTGPQTETGAFLSWFVPWFLIVAVQKMY